MKEIKKIIISAAFICLLGITAAYGQRGYFYTYTFTVSHETVSDESYDVRITAKYKLPKGVDLLNCTNAALPGGTVPDYIETLSVSKGQTIEFKIPILECTTISYIEIDVYSEENKGYTKLGKFNKVSKAYEEPKFSKNTGLIVAYDDVNSMPFAKDLRFIIKEYNKSE